ncbi:MAG: hypothetical protein AB7F79_10360 [Steroidobacteraceae bacterium]
MPRIPTLLALSVLLSLTAYSKEEAPAVATLQPVASVKQLMLGIVIPASDIVFGVAAEAPADDTAWIKVQANAAVIAEVARLLNSDGRKVDNGEWLKFTQALYDSAMGASTAAAEKNVEKVSNAGDALYDSCDGCHMKYMAARQGEASAPPQ